MILIEMQFFKIAYHSWKPSNDHPANCANGETEVQGAKVSNNINILMHYLS